MKNEMGGFYPKIGGLTTPKMDGWFQGKPYEQMDDLGGFPIIFGNTQMKLKQTFDSFPFPW